MACKERTPEQTAILQLLVTLIEVISQGVGARHAVPLRVYLT